MRDITIEEYGNLITPSKEVFDKISELANLDYDSESDIVERGFLDFKLGDNVYWFSYFDKEDIDDDGKYQYGASNYQLMQNKSPMNLFVCVGFCRSGSYFTEYYYEYYKPEVYTVVIEDIPEIIIPAHKNCTFKIIE